MGIFCIAPPAEVNKYRNGDTRAMGQPVTPEPVSSERRANCISWTLSFSHSFPLELLVTICTRLPDIQTATSQFEQVVLGEV